MKQKLLRLALAFGVIASCLGGAAQAETRVDIGYMPILPVSQLFVALDKGWLKSAGIKPNLIQFQNGPAMVQALLSGQLDVAYLGIGPAMVARAKGAAIRVVASCIIQQISFVALPKLASLFKSGDPSTAFARFRQTMGRKPIISTFPRGSVPDTVLEYWLRNELKVDPAEVQIVYQGAAQVQQSLLTGAVDGSAILEPIVSSVLARTKGAAVVAKGAQMFPGQPGAVLAVRETFLRDHPDLVKALVAAQIKAKHLLNGAPNEAAKAVQKYVGGGRLKLATVEAALKRSEGSFVADPNKIVDGTTRMRDFQKKTGTLKRDVDIGKLFDLKVYDSVVANHPAPR